MSFSEMVELLKKVMKRARDLAPGDNVFLAGAKAGAWMELKKKGVSSEVFEEAWREAGKKVSV